MACFQTLIDRHTSNLQLARAWSAYLTAYYLHPGANPNPVAYEEVDQDHHTDDFVRNAWLTRSGQKLIVCRGFAALAHRILGQLKRDGQPAFHLQSLVLLGAVGAGTHVVAVARDKRNGPTIVTNYNTTMIFDHGRADEFIAQHLFADAVEIRGRHDTTLPPVSPAKPVWFGVGDDERQADRAVIVHNEHNMRLAPTARIVGDNGQVRQADVADRAAFAIYFELPNPGTEFSSVWEKVRSETIYTKSNVIKGR